MATATASLFYGLRVQTGDLMAAAHAHKRVVGPQRALRLIQLRRSNCHLVLDTALKSDVLTRVPCEVWALVEQAVIDVENRDSREQLIDRFSCECGNADGMRCEYSAWMNKMDDWYWDLEETLWKSDWLDARDKLCSEFCYGDCCDGEWENAIHDELRSEVRPTS